MTNSPGGAMRQAGGPIWRILASIASLTVVGGVGLLCFFTRSVWLPGLLPQVTEPVPPHVGQGAVVEGGQVLLSPQAQKNLHMVTLPLQGQAYWKSITVPGMVIDRPGFSDRGVVAPATGVVSRILRVPGDTVRVGEPLFTIKLLSESLHLTQTDLFKAAQDIRLAQAQRQRLAEVSDAVSGFRIIEVENQITRLEVATKAYRQELINRGLSPEQVNAAAEGRFVSEITIKAPGPPAIGLIPAPVPEKPGSLGQGLLEIQELKVELGHQMQAGQTFCLVANHQLLCIEGSAFRDELPLLERSLREMLPLDIDFGETDGANWPPLGQAMAINSISNSIDPETRTFHFLIRFDNQSKLLERDGKSQVFWRFRPGQRVRINLRTEKLDNVFVLPLEAVAREGGEAFVFRQNGDIFDRKPVQIIHQDRSRVVIANDGSVPAGIYVAQTGAIQLNRMIKAQSGGTQGFHIHADGSVHKGGH